MLTDKPFYVLFLEDDSELERRAASDYQSVVNSAGLTTQQQETACKVLFNLLLQRFANKTSSQINRMLMFPEILNTVAGREIWEQGRDEGRDEGHDEGRDEGITETLIRLATRRFGALPSPVVEAIHDLEYLQLEQLTDALFDFGSVGELDQWLKQVMSK